MRLKDKVAVITGAARGIGSAIAKRCAAKGASVVINYATRKTEAERTLAAIEPKGGRAFIFTKASEVEKLFPTTKESFSRLDILVNNAGLDDFMTLERIAEEHFHTHYNVNVLSVILAGKEAVKYIDKKE